MRKIIFSVIIICILAVILTGCSDDILEINNEYAVSVTDDNIVETETTEVINQTENVKNEEELSKIESQVEQNSKHEYYSTNDSQTAKKGNSGKFSYINKAKEYSIYYIIDFDDGFIYSFTEWYGEDNSDGTVEKIKILNGDLNKGLELSYKDSENAWLKYVHFKYANQPLQLIIIDNDLFDYELLTTNIDEALELMKGRPIVEQ